MPEATPLGTESRTSAPGHGPSCGEAVVRLLEQYDTDIVFGIPGVHTLEIYRGLAASEIRHVSARHEQGAAFMADGYGRVAGKPGVCTLITGAGLTNAATPIASAYQDSIPLLVISSATARADNGRGHGALHDLPDQRAFMATITADSIDVRDPAELPEAFARAFEIFESRRPRPVHIGIPIDVLDLPASAWERLPARGTRPLADPALVERAVELLASAERPMVLLGGGAVGAGAEATAVAERLGAPVGLTVNAKGVLPDSHPLSLGTTLLLESVHAAFSEADVVLAVGTEFGETDYFYAPGAAAPHFTGSLVRVDIDADQLHRQRSAAIGLHGDAAVTLAAIDAGLAARGRERSTAGDRAAALRARRRWWPGTDAFMPFLAALDRGIPENGILVSDSTQPAYVAHHSWPGRAPRGYIAPGGFGTLGPALPMAIGAQLAAPRRPVVALAGDGGALFTIPELASAADLGLPIALVIWQNDGYGEMRDCMDQIGVPRMGTEVTAHDFLLLAEGFGCRGVRTESLDDLPGALAEAFAADRPTLVEVRG
ncbi:MAG: acetolactate synthase large subunit [Gaiellales bacterium]|jgi:thiamine pyrophosphate-dependent acetolactate synthase large subunit-like protein|nr:acetolactate synthase large subunit [Gaiellales bacterium]